MPRHETWSCCTATWLLRICALVCHSQNRIIGTVFNIVVSSSANFVLKKWKAEAAVVHTMIVLYIFSDSFVYSSIKYRIKQLYTQWLFYIYIVTFEFFGALDCRSRFSAAIRGKTALLIFFLWLFICLAGIHIFIYVFTFTDAYISLRICTYCMYI